MKRFKKFFGCGIISFFAFIPFVLAAPTIATSVSSSSIEVGRSVTFYVTLRNVASWNVHISGIGSTSGCSSQSADATNDGNNTTKTFSVTCKGTGIGIINFSVSGDATSSDGGNIGLSGDKRVNVTAARPKSTNNYLSSLQVGEYTLTPEFDKDTLEYSLTVPSTTNTVTIEAKAADGYASVSGTGEHEVIEGANAFPITVQAENGDERVYTVTVQVEDQNPIRVSLDGKDYTVIKNAKYIIKPELYEESTIQIQGFEIPCYISDVTGYTLVSLKTSDGISVFAIYDKEEDRYQLYEEQKSQSLVLYVMKAPDTFEGFHETTIIINQVSYPAFKIHDDSDFALVYAMNIETGEKNYYLYNQKENTYQLYFDEMVDLLQSENDTYKNVILGFAAFSVCLVILCAFAFLRKPKRSGKASKKVTHEKEEEAPVQEKKEKKSKKSSKKEEVKEDEEKKEPSKEEESLQDDTGVVDVKDALAKMNNVEDMILEYEKTMALSKDEMKKIENIKKNTKEKKKDTPNVKEEKESKKSTEEMEETMYDLFSEDRKKKRKK